MLSAFVFLLHGFFKELMPTPFPLHFPLISGGISAIAASFYCDIMKDVKSSRIIANFRAGIIILLITYFLSSMLRDDVSLGEKFLLGLPNISASLGALYAWDSVISLKQLFSARKRFDEYTEMYSGEQLQDALFGEASLLQYTDEEIIAARRNYFLQLTLLGILLLVNTVLGIPMRPVFYFLMILVLESGVCIIGFLGIFRREQYYAGEGMTLPPFDRTKHMIGTGIFSALCIVIVILLSSDKNLLTIRPVIDFLKWLLELFRRPPPPKLELILPEIEPPPMPLDMEPIFSPEPDVEKKKGLPVWTWFQYIVIGLTAAGFVWFMISPLLNRGKTAKKLTLRQRLGKIITEWAKGVWSALTSFINFIKGSKGRQKLRKPGAEEIRRVAENVLGAYSLAKKRDIRRSVTLFARLIIWGDEVRQVSWKPSHAPGEYCSLLSASGEQWNGEIIRCGELFEQALYSAEPLSDTERKEFKKLVEEITAP
jgi:hypothetical protein